MFAKYLYFKYMLFFRILKKAQEKERQDLREVVKKWVANTKSSWGMCWRESCHTETRVFVHVCRLSHAPESLSLLKCSERTARMWEEGARAGLQVHSTWVEALDRAVPTSPHSWVRAAAARGDVWAHIPVQKPQRLTEQHRDITIQNSTRRTFCIQCHMNQVQEKLKINLRCWKAA